MKFVSLTAPLSATDGDVPSEFVLLRGGVNEYEGGELLFDADAATSVMAHHARRRIDLMADYEHQSLAKGLTGPIPAAAKKWVPELRNGDLVAASIAWTPKARQMLADGEYRYFSIACEVDTKTNRVAKIINFALTNNPAANQIAPLVAASLPFSTEDTNMKNVIVALGLPANAEEADVLTRIASDKDFERNVIALTGKTSRGEALGALTALVAKASDADRVTGELVALKASQLKAEIESLVSEAIKDGRVTPAKKAEMVALADKAGVEGLKACLSLLEKKTQTASEGVREETSSSSAPSDLTAIELSIAQKFVGDDPIALKKHCDNLREYKARPDKLRRAAAAN